MARRTPIHLRSSSFPKEPAEPGPVPRLSNIHKHRNQSRQEVSTLRPPPPRPPWPRTLRFTTDRRFLSFEFPFNPPIRVIWVCAGTVAAALNLTPAQGRVAELLARGWSLVDIAVATGRSDNTIRSHRLQIHRKLGISRRAELVQLVRSVMELPPSRG